MSPKRGWVNTRGTKVCYKMLLCYCTLEGTPTFRFTFSRRFYPKGLTISTFVIRSETIIYHCWYSKDVHRNKRQALTITRLTDSLYTAVKASYCSTIKYDELMQHTVSAYNKCVHTHNSGREGLEGYAESRWTLNRWVLSYLKEEKAILYIPHVM